MNDETFLHELEMLAQQFSAFGFHADLGQMTLQELYGIFLYLKRLSES